jgi:hypothetical protein
MRLILASAVAALQLQTHELASEEWDLRDLPFGVDGMSRRPAGLLELMANRSKPLIYFHIHKAGGSLMCRFARQAELIVHPDENCNWQGHDGYGDAGQVARHVPCDQRRSFFQQNGYTYGQIEREVDDQEMCEDFDYAVMLREPNALMASLWNYELWYAWKGWGATKPEHKDPVGTLRATIEWSEKGCPGSPGGCPSNPSQNDQFWKFFDNFQTRFLANAFHVPAGQLTAEHAKKAAERLEKYRFRVELLEELPARSSSLFAALGWPASFASHIHERVNDDRGDGFHRRTFTTRELDFLETVNHHDRALYEAHRASQAAASA